MKKKAIFCVLATSIILPSQVLSSQNDKTTLSPITIENNLSETTGEYSYYKTKSYSATKTDTPLKEVPQSVQIVNKEIIQDTNSVTLSDTLVYVSGTSYQNNFGGM